MTQPQTADADHHGDHNVAVTLVVTDPDGTTQTQALTIPAGPTKVLELKTELGVPAEASLWLVRPNDKPKQLADHASHNVKAGDQFETIVRGGVS